MRSPELHHRGRLLASCADQPGIVAKVSCFLAEQGANLVDSHQHSTGPEAGRFFLRMEFDLQGLSDRAPGLQRRFTPIAESLGMAWRLELAERAKRVAVFVSREDHCLVELLWQWRARELGAALTMVVSNHEDLRQTVEGHGLPFHHTPLTRETKAEVEARQRELLRGKVDLVVLARYMQVLSADFIREYPQRIINIHHSFLPAFIGANPYGQAHERGVKLIGATAHYVTEALDAGPIIEQDTVRVDHRDDVVGLKRLGRRVEREVLARAVTWHAADRVLVHGNKTVVFR